MGGGCVCVCVAGWGVGGGGGGAVKGVQRARSLPLSPA